MATRGIRLISSDVFDTLLLRTSRSERSRIVLGERLFARILAQRGYGVSPDVLIALRLEAQRLAFRALNVGGAPGEVRLTDIVTRQLAVLGLPESLLAERLRIEVEIEKRSLRANTRLAATLREWRRPGCRLVAISDTTLPASEVKELIEHFHGPDLIDHVYSSADLGLTKRRGDLFRAVADAEGVTPQEMYHFGDDALADLRIPSAHGIGASHTPRAAYRSKLRAANGAWAEAGRRLRAASKFRPIASAADQERRAFGRQVFGPILAQLSILIWLYAQEAERRDIPVLLFCARGGIGMREAFEGTLAKLGLDLAARRENIMISRLIAARAALLAGAPSALEELSREFRNASFADVAQALGGRAYDLPPQWDASFRAADLPALLRSPGGAEVMGDIGAQNALFTRHWTDLTGEADRPILVDTGLYGSTQRMLADALPGARIETLQFARSNYKGHSEAHFPRVTGLFVERNFYNPLDERTSVLRYWHLIESLFEPKVASVKCFSEGDHGQVIANCGDVRFGMVDASAGNELLAGALSYIDDLARGDGAKVLADADLAWLRLKRTITAPREQEVAMLSLGDRSVDFGRAGMVEVMSLSGGRNLPGRLALIKSQLWREGAIARQFPALRHALLPMLGLALSVRGFLARRMSS